MATADPGEAFALLSDGTRLRIVEELAAEQAATPEDPALSFSELRTRAGVRDSGQFNYHLKKLVGSFVEHSDDGYELSFAGLRIVGAVFSGQYDGAPASLETTLDDPCPACGADRTVTYESGLLGVRCASGHEFGNLAPPRLFEGRDVAEVVDVVARISIGDLERAGDGVCPLCFGRVTWSMRESDEGPEDAPPVSLFGSCGTCGVAYTVSPGGVVPWDRAVDARLREFGVDVRADPARWVVESQAATVESYDLAAGTATASLSLDECSATATVDERGDVLDFEVTGPDADAE